MTSEWIVAIEATAEGSTAELPKATFADLVETVADTEVVALYSPDRYAVQLHVMALNALEALEVALRRWSDGVRSIGAPTWDVVRAEVMTPAEFAMEFEVESGGPQRGETPTDANASVTTVESADPGFVEPRGHDLASDDRWRLILQDCHERVILLSAEGSVLGSLPGLGSSGVAGQGQRPTTLADLGHPDDVILAQDALADLMAGEAERVTFTIRLRDRDGWRWYSGRARNLLDEQLVGAIVVSCRDITKEKELEDRLAELAHHDELTGLVTRAVFLDALELALARSVERSQAGVFFVDVDDFRAVVERFGTEAADRVLMAIGERMKSLRDGAAAARLGRDEFALLYDNVADSAEAGQIAKRIAATLSEPVAIDGEDVGVSLSIGVALGRAERLQAATLLRHAEVAMYRARRGRARYEIFRRRRQSPTVSDLTNDVAGP